MHIPNKNKLNITLKNWKKKKKLKNWRFGFIGKYLHLIFFRKIYVNGMIYNKAIIVSFHDGQGW